MMDEIVWQMIKEKGFQQNENFFTQQILFYVALSFQLSTDTHPPHLIRVVDHSSPNCMNFAEVEA